MDPIDLVYEQYRELFRGALAELEGLKQPPGYKTGFAYATVADAATAIQMAVDDRLVSGRFGERRPFRTVNELVGGASGALIPPHGRQIRVERKLYDVVTSQPARVGERLGPVSAAVNRTMAWASTEGLIVKPAALVTVTRTIEQKYLRKSALGMRSDGLLDLAAIAGVTHENGGASLLHAAHPHIQDSDDVPAALLEYHAAGIGFDLGPLRMRLEFLHAVFKELLECTGAPIPVIQRAERRFDEPFEGSITSEQLWYAAEQEDWSAEVDDVFPEDAVVAGERSVEGLRGFRYQTTLGDRAIEPNQFIRDVEKGFPSLMRHYLTCSDPAVERGLAGADDVVRLEGRLVAPDGEAFRAVVVLSYPHTNSVVYVIPAERSATMDEAAWDAFRAGLAPLHGSSTGRSSDDQGLGISLPRAHGLEVSSSSIDKASNLDAFRSFSHAICERSHWLDWPPGTDPGEIGNDDDEAEAA